jgi:hypothetical protein
VTRTARFLAGAGAAVALGASVVAVLPRASDGPRQRPLDTALVTLAIEPFRLLEPAPQGWMADEFAESLATRLNHMPGLDVRLAAAGATGTAVWTATYWRGEPVPLSLVSDVAGGAAEALYGQLPRRP